MVYGLDPAYKIIVRMQLVIVLAVMWLFCFTPPLFIPDAPIGVITLGFILVTLLIAVPVLVWIPVYYNSFSFELKDDFVEIKKGVITKKEIKIPYSRIQDVNIIRGFIQRRFEVATIQIQTAGQSAVSSQGVSAEGVIPGIKNPEKVVDAIMENVKETKVLGGQKPQKDVQSLILEELKDISKKLGK